MFKQRIISLPSIHNTDTKAGRYYVSPNGSKYWSVTTVLGRMQDKSGLDEWKKKVGEEEANKILRQAGVRGTSIHNIAEKYVMNDPTYFDGEMPFNKTAFKPIKKALDKHLECVHVVEAGLYSDKLKVAGRCDLIGIWDGKLSIIDFKTSRKVKKREWIHSYFMQESLYAFMLYEILLPENHKLYENMQLVTVMTVDHEDDPFIFVESAKEWGPKAVKLVLDHNKKFGLPE